MGEKTLNIFIEDITYMFYCLSMICTFCIWSLHAIISIIGQLAWHCIF
jgi:hypothetical protein